MKFRITDHYFEIDMGDKSIQRYYLSSEEYGQLYDCLREYFNDTW